MNCLFGRRRYVLQRYMLFNILMSPSTDKQSDRGAVWIRSCMGWHYHIDANEFNKDLHEENLEFCLCLQQAIFYKYSWLSLQQILSTKMAAPAQTKGPFSPVTCLQEQSTTDVLHKSTCIGQAHSGIYAEYSFKTILGEFQWQRPCLLFKKLCEGFSPTFS